MPRLIYRGAEAELWKTDYLGLPCIEKRRIAKKYRIREIDEKLRSDRIRQEARLMRDARGSMATPHIYDVDPENCTITMEHIDGKRAKEEFLAGRVGTIPLKMGKAVASLHKHGIVHNDLTTSNIIMRREPYFIDFGLAARSGKLEDQAVDILVFKKMLKSTHYKNFDRIWERFLGGYSPSRALLKKIAEIEGRARYAER
jgi:Kae1-associated kinase Bud32